MPCMLLLVNYHLQTDRMHGLLKTNKGKIYFNIKINLKINTDKIIDNISIGMLHFL